MMRVAVVISIAVGLATVPEAAAGPRGHRCGTSALLRERPVPPLATTVPRLAGGGPKLVRDGFGGSFQQYVSTNFAVKWRDPTVTQAQAQAVAAALELAWQVYVDELGHAPCTGCETFVLNAYIARAQDNPGIDFDGGYAWIDDAGYPYFVISRSSLGEGVAALAAHEFYHDIQFSTGAFAWDTTDYGWFWEATAEWATQEALPTAADPYVFSGAFALRSELPLYHYGDPFGSDFVEGVQQYGAAIFFRHLTDKLRAPGVIVNAWEQAGPNDEPLAAIEARLPSSNLVELHTEFAARNAIWDYPHRHHILGSIQAFQGAFPELNLIAGLVPPGGVGMTPLARSPYGFGYATIELRRPPTGWFEIEVQMAPSTVRADLHGTVVYGEPGAATYTPLVIDGATGTLTMNVPDTVVQLYLVLSATTSERLTGQPIPLSYRVTPVEPPPVEEPDLEAGGCCETGSSPAGSLVALGVLGVVLRRRRR